VSGLQYSSVITMMHGPTKIKIRGKKLANLRKQLPFETPRLSLDYHKQVITVSEIRNPPNRDSDFKYEKCVEYKIRFS